MIQYNSMNYKNKLSSGMYRIFVYYKSQRIVEKYENSQFLGMIHLMIDTFCKNRCSSSKSIQKLNPKEVLV